MKEYDAQKLALEMEGDNENLLLQFSLKVGVKDVVAGCEEAIIATEAESVRSEIQHSRYRESGNPWGMGEDSDCGCLRVSKDFSVSFFVHVFSASNRPINGTD